MRFWTSLAVFSFLLSAAEPLLAQSATVTLDLRLGTYEGGYLRGEATAKRHLQQGKLRFLTDGGLTPTRGEKYERALSAVFAEHGVELVPAGACVSPPDELGYIAGYNAIVKAEMDRRFGPGFLARMELQAVAQLQSSSK